MKASSGPQFEKTPSCALAATRRAARLLTQLYDSYLKEHGIEGTQFGLLMTIDGMGPSDQTTIAQRMGMDKTTLSRNVKVLAARGWIEMAPGEDARRRELALTREGRAVLTHARPAWDEAQRSLRAALQGLDWTKMLGAIDALSSAAERAEPFNRASGQDR
jgi:DNA-binding MarR family transcriptional regulator